MSVRGAGGGRDPLVTKQNRDIKRKDPLSIFTLICYTSDTDRENPS